jgi:MtrB/PioB family decaheme-associated outer membrane protein
MAMKAANGKMKASVLALAVQGALGALYAMPASAQDESAASLRAPASYAELGVLNVTRNSYKFGEYSGLRSSGVYLNGNFDLRGGDAYGEGNGTHRWEIHGSDLGLTSRSVGATVSNQGRWSFGVNFDQLTHYTSDSYQTPYSGTMGGNSFTLPSFGTAANARTLSAAQLSQFQTMRISNDRQNSSATGTIILDRQWSIKVDFNRLEQTGAKLMGFGGAAIGGATGERVAILPMPTNYRTDTLNAALNWVGERAYASASYFGSFFRDNYNGVSFQTWAGANTTETMGTPPSNDFHQLNLTGGYALSKRTKLAGGLSYGYNSQNAAYAYDNITPTVMVTPAPTSSLNGSVRTSHADLKLTDQTTRNLILTGGFKYDFRDNQTASNIYNFNAISGGNTANYPNAPLSYKKEQLELAGDYRLTTFQKVRLSYNHDDTHRFCNDYASGGGTPPYAPGTNCVTVPRTKEDKIGFAYRLRASEGVNLNAAYSFANRRSDRDFTARAPMIGLDGNPTAAGIASTATGGITGLNGGEFRGFNPFFEASRKQHMVKAGANWQPGERLSFGLSGRVTEDDYGTTYGMQRGSSWGVNLDGTYVYREQGSITAYVTQQERTRALMNDQRSPLSAPTATIPSGATWNNRMTDTDTTLGLGVKQGGLMNNRLELLGDMTYSLAKTKFNTTLNYALLSGAPCSDPSIYTCVPLPDIRSELFSLKFTGVYQVAKNGKVSAGYLYQRLKADDFYYNGLQTGFTPTSVLPTNQTAPTYSVIVVFASYIYSF